MIAEKINGRTHEIVSAASAPINGLRPKRNDTKNGFWLQVYF